MSSIRAPESRDKPERHVNRKQRDFYDVKHERHHHTMAAEFHQQPLDLKMVFLGDSAVGKTALLRRFNTGFPPEEDQPAPADAYSFTDSIQLDGKKYLVRCWEVGLWAEGYERLRPLSYPGTDVFLLCFDIKNRASFTNIKDSWIPEICHHMPYTPFLIVGNKMDLRKRTTDQVDVSNTVSTQEAWEVAKLHDTTYIENSSVTGEQVSGVIHMAIRKVAYLQKLNSRCRCRFKLFKWNKCKKHK